MWIANDSTIFIMNWIISEVLTRLQSAATWVQSTGMHCISHHLLVCIVLPPSIRYILLDKTIQGVKKTHVRGHSKLASRGKELHDRAIKPFIDCFFFVQEGTSTTQPTYEQGLLPLQISSISPSIQNITRCIIN